MSIEYRSLDERGTPVLVIEGRVGFEDIDDFQQQLSDLRDRSPERAIVDLTGCPFLASRAFPHLFQASEEMRLAKKRMLIACSDELLRILRVLRLDSRLAVHPDRDACHAAMEPE